MNTRSSNKIREDSEEDDTLEELPEIKSTPTISFDGTKSTSTAESLMDFLQEPLFLTTR